MTLHSIGQVTGQTGLSADTLRYYERIGLLNRIRRSNGGQRQYSDGDIARLGFIRRAQSMNFSLEEIAQLLLLREAPGDVRGEVRGMTEQKLRDIDERIRELSRLREELRELVEACRASTGGCPIISHMTGDTT